MKQFDPTKPCRTRDGREVRIYATDGGRANAIHGAVSTPDGWLITNWKVGGYGITEAIENSYDLINIPARIKREFWVNVYEDGFSQCLKSKEDANRSADKSSRKACLRFEIDCEEGEGL
jgi:hypothetical protein